MKEFKCENGIVYKVPDKSCLLCANCSVVFWDYTNGPYLIFCDTHTDPITDGMCIDFKEKDNE